MPSAATPRVLVADDQSDVVVALRLLLREAGFDADPALSIPEVRERLAHSAYDLLLMDLNYARDTTSGREGLDLLAEVHGRYPALPVVVMTGWGTIETAVEAMRRGARTFVAKPWDNTALAQTIAREVTEGQASRESGRLARREQEEAQRIQRGLLPTALPATGALDLAARWQPALAFGGDWYDVFPANGQLALSIADVCGKGLPAALLMANLQAAARAFAGTDPAPAAIAAQLNRALARMDAPRRLVTGFYALYDDVTRQLIFTNAGHNAPLLVGADGIARPLAGGGMVLGAFDDSPYESHTVTLRPGDRLVLYTDGITEAERGDGAQFGDAGLLASITHRVTLDAAAIVDGIFDDASQFAGGPFHDDATVVVAAVR